MATIAKTQAVSVIAWSDIATANVTIGSVVDCSTALAAAFFVKMGRRSGTAFTAGWPNFRVEGSAKSSGNDSWIPLCSFQPAIGTSIANTTLNGAVSAGATSCVVTSATGISAGDLLYLDGDTDAGNEIVRVKSVSGTTVTFEEACTNAHSSGNAVTDQAETYVAQVDCSSLARLRAVADNAGSGQTMACEILAITGDSIA